MHTLCAGKPGFDEQGNNISVKRFERACGPEMRYKRTNYYYYYHHSTHQNIFLASGSLSIDTMISLPSRKPASTWLFDGTTDRQ